MTGSKNVSTWVRLTVDEADVLRSVLGTGADVARAVDAPGNHDLLMDAHDVICDVSEARRLRWNRENPCYRYEA